MSPGNPFPKQDAGAKTAGSSEQQPVSGDGRIDDEVVAREATRAWFGAFFNSPATLRSNAQAGYTVAAAVAAGIVAAGLFAGVEDAPPWTQAFLLLTLLLWLLAAWRFMRAVAIQPNLGGVRHEGSRDELADQAIQRIWWERATVARRSWAAQRTARVAGVATLVALGLGVFGPVPESRTDVSVMLTEDGSAHFARLCGGEPTAFDARMDLDDLGEPFVEVETSACGGETRTLALRTADIAATATR